MMGYLGNAGYSWEFLVGVCRRFSQSWPHFRPKNVIFTPVLRPGVSETMSSLLRLERQVKYFLNHVEFVYYFFFSYALGTETTNTFIHFRSSLTEKVYPIPYQNGQNVYPFLDLNGLRTIPFGATHTYMAYVR